MFLYADKFMPGMEKLAGELFFPTNKQLFLRPQYLQLDVVNEIFENKLTFKKQDDKMSVYFPKNQIQRV